MTLADQSSDQERSPESEREASDPPEMPVFDGARQLVELVGQLYRRPRIGELPPRTTGERGRRRRHGLPMLCLVRPAGVPILEALSGYLTRTGTGQGRIPHALITFPLGVPESQRAADADPPVPDTAEERELKTVRSILFALAEEFGNAHQVGMGRIRFRRFGLVNWLLGQKVRGHDADSDNLDPDKVLLGKLRERSLSQRRLPDISDEVHTELSNNLPVPWWVRPLLPLLRRVPPLWFALKTSGRLPFFGTDYRWLLRQPFLAPHDPGTFVGFAVRLTIGFREREVSDEILKLMVNAFLEDLRRAYRRPLWRPRGARRTTYAIAMFDGIRRDNGGYRVLKLVNDVRNGTGAFDPLLVISASEKLPPEARDPDSLTANPHLWAARDALVGYRAWCNDSDRSSRKREPTAWYLPVRIPPPFVAPPPASADGDIDQARTEYDTARGMLRAVEPFTVDDPPVWARARVLYPILVAVLLVVAASGYTAWQRQVDSGERWRRAHCDQPATLPGAELLRRTSTGECIGLNEGWYPFQRTDGKLTTVLVKIYEQNQRVAELHASQPQRPYVTIAHVAALSSPSGPVEGLVAQREALAGIAAMQARRLDADQGVLVRVLIGNAGDQMRNGPEVARMLGAEAARDPSIVGVIGLGQSRQSTVETIKELTIVGLPMVASSLTADAMVAASPMYFQVAPQNRREADVAARYASNVIQRGRRLASRAIIIQSNDGEDLYSDNLAQDARSSFKNVGFAVSAQHYQLDPPPAKPLIPTAADASEVGRSVCGFGGVVFFAGRTRAFESFLDGVKQKCGSHAPAILAGDDISRYVADPRQRTRYGSIPFDYLTLAVGQQHCGGASDLYRTLKQLFPEDCAHGLDPSLDGHAAQAYDATYVMVTAVQNLHNNKWPLIPATVWRSISGISGSDPLEGETGIIDFGGSIKGQVPVSKAIAVLRNDGSLTPTPQAFCGRHQTRTAEPWCPA